jgi:hypothetical protein
MKRGILKRARPGPVMLLASLLLFVPTMHAQDCSLDWFTIDGGGGQWSDGYYTIIGTIGQPDTGEWTDGYYTIVGGFWGGIEAAQQPGAPWLTIHRTSTNAVVLSWPAPAPGWVLQEGWNMSGGPWFTIIPPLTQAAGRLEASLPNASGYKFYRLKQQSGTPVLSVQPTGTNTLVTWPAPAPGWVLEQRSPSGGNFWALPEAPCMQVDGQMQVVLPSSASGDFYRLTMAPVLTITRGLTNSILVSWLATATGWALQECPTLSSNTWSTVSTPPVQSGAETRVTLSSTGTGRFFRLAQASPAPRLSVARSAPHTVVVSWATPAVGWVLEESSTLGSGTWTLVSAQPVPVGDNLQVTISPALGNRFYRLKHY